METSYGYNFICIWCHTLIMLIITDLGGNNITPDKLLYFTSKRFGNIACGFNHREVNGNDYALKGRGMINPKNIFHPRPFRAQKKC